MEKMNFKKLVVGLAASGMLVCSLGLAACGGSSSGSSNAKATSTAAPAASTAAATAAAPGEAAGFTEVTIENAKGDMLDGIEVGNLLSVSGVYFQPVPMSMGNDNIEDFDLHLEADIAALENTVGYEVGSWVPYLTVDYVITKPDGTAVTNGTFMEMSASDGPHYGANIKLDEGTYNISFIIHSPEENGYLVHTDAETGPGGTFDQYFANGNLQVDFEGWEFVKQGW